MDLSKESARALVPPEEDAFSMGDVKRKGFFGYEYTINYYGDSFAIIEGGTDPVSVQEIIKAMNKGYRMGWADGSSNMRITDEKEIEDLKKSLSTYNEA
jgi:hypothetical protein